MSDARIQHHAKRDASGPALSVVIAYEQAVQAETDFLGPLTIRGDEGLSLQSIRTNQGANQLQTSRQTLPLRAAHDMLAACLSQAVIAETVSWLRSRCEKLVSSKTAPRRVSQQFFQQCRTVGVRHWNHRPKDQRLAIRNAAKTTRAGREGKAS